MSTITVTPNSARLLTTWLRCNCTGPVYLESRDGKIRTYARLSVTPGERDVQLRLQYRDTINTLTLPIPARIGQLADQVHQWVEDCANGRLEAAA